MYTQGVFYCLSEELHQNLLSFLEKNYSYSGEIPVKLFHISNSSEAYSLSVAAI